MDDTRTVTMFRGDALVHARGRRVEILHVVDRGAQPVEAFEVERPVSRLIVAADGSAVIGRDAMQASWWLWRPGLRLRELAATKHPRDRYSFALVRWADRTLILSSCDEKGELRGETLDGERLFAANTLSPHAFFAHRFVELGRGRIGIVGSVFGDSSDTAFTVTIDALMGDPRAVQDALDARVPLIDRAPRLAMGRCGDDAVLFRDPEADELPDDDDDPEDLPDVWGFRGFYVRDLGTGALKEKVPYGSTVLTGVMVATAARFAVQVKDGVDLIDRTSGVVHHVAGATTTLDPVYARIASLGDDGIWIVRSVDT